MAGFRSFDAAYRAIRRGELAPVYYLTGTEDVLKDELVSLIRDQVLDPSTRDFNFDARAAADLDGESLHALIETPPMLAERRVVIVRYLEQWRRNAKVWQVLRRYLANPSPTTVLVLTHGAGEKVQRAIADHAETVDAAPLNPDRLRRWVGVQADRVGITLETEAVEHLLRALGDDLSLLSVEIDKLGAAVGSDRPVGAPDVAALVGIRRGETPSDWVAAVLGRDVTRAVEMVDDVLASAGVTAVRLVTLLGTTLVGTRVARSVMDRDGTGSRVERAVFDAIKAARPPGLRGWSDEARTWTAACRRWGAGALDAAIRATYDADRLLKSSTVSDERGILINLVLRVGGDRRAAA